jgi:signal transduction histidine kinase
MHCKKWFWRFLLVFWGLQASHLLVLAAPLEAAPEPVALRIQSATLTSPLGERTVALPHVLSNSELDAKGSRVRYRLSVDLPQAPEQALGVFINKLSLAGALYVNGELVDQCADGDMARLRCLHLTLLFKPATQLWHAGTNTLEIEVHGNHGQVNGLSEVVVGDAHRLYRDVYLPQFAWRITLYEWLALAILMLGALSLTVGVSLREESVYYWYGLTCLLLAASLSNLIADELPLSMHFWNWLIVTGRLLAAHLFVLTCLHLFGKQRAWQTRWTLGYALVFATVFYVFTENRLLVSVAYLPMLVITPVLIGFMVRWSVQSGNSRHIVTCSLMILLFLLGARDWLKFGGQGSFEFVYLMPLGFAATIMFMGFLLTGQLIDSLRIARELSASLESKVAARTEELRVAHEQLTRVAIQHSKNEEREMLLQDMHDGFGSQLASARLMADAGTISPGELSTLLQECMADLYLVADTLSTTHNSLLDSLADMRFRLEKRTAHLPIELSWDLDIDKAPELQQRTILQLLRIIQEAINNAMKHAQAKHIQISVTFDPQAWYLQAKVTDNGLGYPDKPVLGRGVYNMQQRARMVGATLLVTQSHPGTCVMLSLPLPRA